MSRKGLLIDVAECRGCYRCVEACKRKNGLPFEGVRDETLSYRSFTVVQKKDEQFVRKMCMHCETPSCVTVCPVGALVKKESGAVVYDADRCMGCRYCMVACPFGVPTFEWNEWNPRVRKCILCADRIEQGLPPACAEACPTEATLFGDRDQLIEVAQYRIRKHAEKYSPEVVGLVEAGGTSVLYLAPLGFTIPGLSMVAGKKPPTEVSWRILQQVPNVVLLGAVFLSGTYWLYRRRLDVARAEASVEGEKSHA